MGKVGRQFSFRGMWRSVKMRLILTRFIVRCQNCFVCNWKYRIKTSMCPGNRSYNRKDWQNWVWRVEHRAKDSAFALSWILVLIFFWHLFTCSLCEMMTLKHFFGVCIQYPRIQNVLYFLFCFTLRPNVVGANSKKTDGGNLSLYFDWG